MGDRALDAGGGPAPGTPDVLLLDAAGCRHAASVWIRWADELHASGFDLANDLGALMLAAHASAPHEITAAATELWVTGSFARLVAERVERADRSFDASRPDSVARLRSIAGATARQRLFDGCAPTWASSTYSPPGGDLGETGDAEVRSPYSVAGATPTERGRNLLMRAIADTGDARQIRADEFEVVRLDTGRYVVVLPGVTDLGAPDPGWHEGHRSVRDVDQAAFRSSRSTSVADNAYARLVWDGIVGLGVPVGSELLVVGHSFGADTALDLAADPAFNGPAGYRITHVVAAGYHSGPQLPSVPDSTQVLVLQNHRDGAVIAEAIGAAGPTDAIVARAEALALLAELDVAGAAGRLASAVHHDGRTLWAGAVHAASRLDDLGRAAVGALRGDGAAVVDGLADAVTLEPGVRTPTPRQVVDVFEGGGDRFGHHQQHYLAHLDEVDHPAVTGFLASVAHAGYARSGAAFAIDVSVPTAGP